MKKHIKTAGSILALAILAACGGGDGNSSGSGGSGGGGSGGGSGGGGSGGDTPAALYTKQQMEWAGHESFYTAVGVTQIPGLIAEASLGFVRYAAAHDITTDSEVCDGDSPGTVTATFTDGNGNHKIDNGDKVTFKLVNCRGPIGDELVDGTVTITYSDVTGNLLDGSSSSATMTIPLANFKLDGSETLNGTVVIDYARDTKDTADDGDDTLSVQTAAERLDIGYSRDGKSYATRIEDYSSDYTYARETRLYTFSAIGYRTSGTDPLLGTFNHTVKMTTPLVYWRDLGDGSPDTGAFETKTPGETITTTIVLTETEDLVEIKSTSGLSSKMDFAAFDDL